MNKFDQKVPEQVKDLRRKQKQLERIVNELENDEPVEGMDCQCDCAACQNCRVKSSEYNQKQKQLAGVSDALKKLEGYAKMRKIELPEYE